MEEGKTMENLDAHMGWLGALVDDEAALPSEKMHHLLLTLRRVQAETQEREAPFKAIIQAEELKMAKAMTDLDIYQARVRAALEECLETEFEHDKWKFEGEAGTAQLVKPKPRVSYDIKGLETLRRSSDETDRLIGHLRTVKPSKPYLKVKLK